MRNILPVVFLLALGAAWAADPLVGPGKVGEKDEKGHVKGVDSGAGPHKHFTQQQFERRVDRPEEAIEKDKKEKEAKAKKEEKESAGTGR